MCFPKMGGSMPTVTRGLQLPTRTQHYHTSYTFVSPKFSHGDGNDNHKKQPASIPVFLYGRNMSISICRDKDSISSWHMCYNIPLNAALLPHTPHCPPLLACFCPHLPTVQQSDFQGNHGLTTLSRQACASSLRFLYTPQSFLLQINKGSLILPFRF
jgi:hypothetical protein